MFSKTSVIGIVLSLLLVSQALMIAAHPSVAVQQEKERNEKKGAEPHPHIRGALMELREAKRELQTAAHDFGGHRKEAVEAVDVAINQLQQALQYDKK